MDVGGESGGGADCRTIGGRDAGGEGEGNQYRADKLGEFGVPGKGRFWGGEADRINHVAGGGPDTQGGRGLPRHRPHGGSVEGSGND